MESMTRHQREATILPKKDSSFKMPYQHDQFSAYRHENFKIKRKIVTFVWGYQDFSDIISSITHHLSNVLEGWPLINR